MRLAVVGPVELENIETFIKAHLEHLSDEVYLFHGGFFPDKLDGKPLMKNTITRRFLKKCMSRIYKNKYEEVQLAKLFKKVEIDIVLAEYGPTGVAIQRSCELANIPLMVHYHGFDISKHTVLESYENLYQKMFEKANGIVGVSKDMCQKLRDIGAPSEKLIYNPYGVDTDFFKPNTQEKKRYDLIFVGRFVEKKSPILTILMLKELIESNPDINMVMVGDGPLLGTAKKIAKALNLEKIIEFKGNCSHKEVRDLMHASNIYVQHSVTAEDGDSEGTPVSILEAMAAGLPVVSTRHAGIKEAVDNDENGILVDEKDIGSMKAGIEKLYTDESIRKSMSINARDKILKDYSMNLRISVLRDELEKIIYQKLQ